jgi:hypothetical protein
MQLVTAPTQAVYTGLQMTMLSQDDANEATDDIVDPTVSNQNHQQAPICESERELRGRERVCVCFSFLVSLI